MASKAKPDFTGAVQDRAADAIFGAPAVPPSPPSSPNQVARPTDIYLIIPDARQPRRQIPSVIRSQWNGDSDKVVELFAAWVNGFAEESGRDASEIEDVIDMVLEGEEVSPAEVYQGEQADPKRHWGVIGGSLMAVVNLAAEIRRDGLTNPITVHRVGNNFLIETGERRWLAFHLLHIFYSDSAAWTKIPAREVQQSSVWRQAGENTARSQLNAIGMARQLAILLMDLYAGEDFMSFDEVVFGGLCDRAYYAQVADGNKWRVPRGKGEQLVNAMGIKNPQQLRNFRDLLRLPNEVWTLADDLNWTEYFIRAEIVDKAVNESGMIALAQYHADAAGYRVIESGHTVSTDTVSTPDEVDLGEDAVDQEVAWLGEEDAILGNGTSEAIPNEPEVDSDSETDEAQIDPALEYWQVKVLEFAYERAQAGKPWFAAKDSPSSPERLNLLIEKHLLRGSSAYTNKDYAAAHYAISGQGCAALGRPFVATPQPERKPVSGGEFHGGSADGGKTPPVQSDPNAVAAERQAKLEKKMLEQLEELKNQFMFQASKIALEQFKTHEGSSKAYSLLQRIKGNVDSLYGRINKGK